MEALGLAYIVLGLIFGTSIGWLLSKGKVSSESTASEQELYRLRALIEAKEEVFEGTREQMLDAYKLAPVLGNTRRHCLIWKGATTT